MPRRLIVDQRALRHELRDIRQTIHDSGLQSAQQAVYNLL